VTDAPVSAGANTVFRRFQMHNCADDVVAYHNDEVTLV